MKRFAGTVLAAGMAAGFPADVAGVIAPRPTAETAGTAAKKRTAVKVGTLACGGDKAFSLESSGKSATFYYSSDSVPRTLGAEAFENAGIVINFFATNGTLDVPYKLDGKPKTARVYLALNVDDCHQIYVGKTKAEIDAFTRAKMPGYDMPDTNEYTYPYESGTAVVRQSVLAPYAAPDKSMRSSNSVMNKLDYYNVYGAMCLNAFDISIPRSNIDEYAAALATGKKANTVADGTVNMFVFNLIQHGCVGMSIANVFAQQYNYSEYKKIIGGQPVQTAPDGRTALVPMTVARADYEVLYEAYRQPEPPASPKG